MITNRARCAVIALQWTLGVVILIEAILFILPSAAHSFARTHMPNAIRLVVGFGEIIGSLLMLYPRTAARGAWILMAILLLAIVIHLLHGMYGVGNLLIYGAAAWVVAEERK
jgi:cell division protein FtsW (lipid II flippase)